MSERAGWGEKCTALRLVFACAAVLSSAGCAQDMELDFAVDEVDPYRLGGQTGSLIPGCGVAPLSAQGQSVPAGRALAVFYGKDCPALTAEGRLALLGAGLETSIELVPLDEHTFLVQAPDSVPAGEYQLELDEQESTVLSVAEGERVVPASFGTLAYSAERSAGNTSECPEQLRFTLELDDAALALVPLARLDVSIDGGPLQLWVDYGALPLERDDTGSRGLLELPRCAAGCLAPGPHQLSVMVSIAGEARAPEVLEAELEPCPLPAEQANDAGGCALRAPGRARGAALGLGVLAAALALSTARRVRSCSARTPPRSTERSGSGTEPR